VSKKIDPLDEVCDKCGWHRWEHEKDHGNCPSAHRTSEGRWPGGYHKDNHFSPSGRYDESLCFEQKQRPRDSDREDRY